VQQPLGAGFGFSGLGNGSCCGGGGCAAPVSTKRSGVAPLLDLAAVRGGVARWFGVASGADSSTCSAGCESVDPSLDTCHNTGVEKQKE